MEEENERLAQALTAARIRIKKLGAQVSPLSHPPAPFATSLKAHADDKSIGTYIGGRKMNLVAAASLRAESLTIGQEAHPNKSLVVVKTVGYEEIRTIVETGMLMDERQALTCVH